MAEKEDLKKHTARINVENIGTYEVPTGSNLRETLRREGLFVDGTCADRGTCGRCIVRILRGKTGEPSRQEEQLLKERSSLRGDRLACRITVENDLAISIDRERLLEVDHSGLWKEAWGSVLWRPHLISPDYSGFGVAADLGTTSIATALFDMADARPLDIKAGVNPCLPWGEDIISRLQSAAEDVKLAAKLKDLTWKSVGEQIRSLCLRNGISAGRITRVVAVGNSAVHHLSIGRQHPGCRPRLLDHPAHQAPHHPHAADRIDRSRNQVCPLSRHLPPPERRLQDRGQIVTVLAIVSSN